MSAFMGMGTSIPNPGPVTTPSSVKTTLSKRTSRPRTHGFGQNAPCTNSANRSPSRSFRRSQSTDAHAARTRSKEEAHRYIPLEAKFRVSSNHTEGTRIPSAEIDRFAQTSYEMPNLYINGGGQRSKINGTARHNDTRESLSQTTLNLQRGRDRHTDMRRTRTGESHRASPSRSPDSRPRTASAFSDIVLAPGKGVRTSLSQLTPVHVKLLELRSFRGNSPPDSSINLGVGLVDYGSSPQVASQGDSFPSMRRPPSSSRTGAM